MKHQVGKYGVARIMHLATARARCQRMAQLGQRNILAVLGDQAGFAEQPLTTALVALDVHRCPGIVGEVRAMPFRSCNHKAPPNAARYQPCRVVGSQGECCNSQ